MLNYSTVYRQEVYVATSIGEIDFFYLYKRDILAFGADCFSSLLGVLSLFCEVNTVRVSVWYKCREGACGVRFAVFLSRGGFC